MDKNTNNEKIINPHIMLSYTIQLTNEIVRKELAEAIQLGEQYYASHQN